jgi:hypothetical protein
MACHKSASETPHAQRALSAGRARGSAAALNCVPPLRTSLIGITAELVGQTAAQCEGE